MADMSDAEVPPHVGEPEEPAPVCESPHVEDAGEKKKTKLKEFWSKYVVPKFRPDGHPAPCDEDAEMNPESTPSQDDGDDEPGVEDGPSSDEGSTCEPEDDDSLIPSHDDASFHKELFKIDPQWKGDKPWVYKSGGRMFTYFPSEFTYDRTLPDGSVLPDTPPLGSPWAKELGGDTSSSESHGPASEKGHGEESESEERYNPGGKADSAESESEERYNPGGKADDMPPCGKFGVEDYCCGPNCRACQLALEEDGDPSGTARAAFALSELFEPRSGEKRKSPPTENGMTLKTPRARNLISLAPLWLTRQRRNVRRSSMRLGSYDLGFNDLGMSIMLGYRSSQ